MKSGKKISVALVQTPCSADREANRKRALKLVRSAAAKGANVICLQELYDTPYFCVKEDSRNFRYAAPLEDPSIEALSKIARETGTVIIVPFFEKRAEGLYHNTATVIDANGHVLGHYRKTHIPDDPYFYEKYYFAPGDLGYKSFQTKFGRIGVLICWDQWFPEPARLTALTGAEIIFYPSAIGWIKGDSETDKENHQAWETVMRGHAVANGCYVAAVNRVGREGPLTFWGRSFIADPYGTVTARAGMKEQILLSQIDPAKITERRHNWPFLRDRRVDTYPDIAKLYRRP